jgi:hypothetical protein
MRKSRPDFFICVICVLVILSHTVSAVQTENKQSLHRKKSAHIGKEIRFYGDVYQLQTNAEGKPQVKDGKVELRGDKDTRLLKYFGRDDPSLYEALKGELTNAYIEYLDWTKLCEFESLNDEEQEKYGYPWHRGGQFRCEIKAPVVIKTSVIQEVVPVEGESFTLLSFQRLELNEVTFLGGVDFRKTIFNNGIKFDSDVRGYANFGGARFLDSAMFSFSEFSAAGLWLL